MAIEFDTGAAVPVDTALAAAIIGRIAPMVFGDDAPASALGPYLRVVKRIAWPLEPGVEYSVEQFARNLVQQLPATAVYIGDGSADGMAGHEQGYEDVEVLVYCANQHPADTVSGRTEADGLAALDSRNNPGLDVHVQHTYELLHGFWPDIAATAGGTAQALRYKDRQRALFAPEMTVVCMRFMCKVARPNCSDRTPTEIIASYRVDHDVQAQEDEVKIIASQEITP